MNTKNNHGIRFLAATLLLFVLVSSVSAYILDPASTGFGGDNRTENGKNMTRNWLFNNATVMISMNNLNYLVVPWFATADDTVMNSTYLHGFQNGSWPRTNESFPIVTDELSLAFHNIAMYQLNDTLADAMINTIGFINDTGNTYASGKTGSVLTEWTFRANYSAGVGWNIYKDQVADTAIDADAYIILALGFINQSGRYNTSNSQRAGARMALMCAAMVSNEIYNATSLNLINRVNQHQTVRYFECGGSNVCSGLTSTDFDFQAYKGPVLESLAACKSLIGDTAATNYSLIAEDIFQNHLIQANWTPDRFTLGQGRAGKYYNASSGQMPAFQCTNSCNNTPTNYLGTEDPDAMRIPNICRAAWAWSNLTGRTLQNSSAYCLQFAQVACLTSTTFGYKMNFTGDNYGTCADGGFKPVGLGSALFFMYNNSQYTNMLGQYNSHYGTCSGSLGLCEMDSQSSFGVYDKSFGLTTMGYAIGLMDAVFGGNGTQAGSGVLGAIDILVRSPTNGTSVLATSAMINITVRNNNNSDVLNNTAGTLPQTLYNSTFSANPDTDGWTMNSWDWTANGGGVINNTADSGGAAWTQNLSLGQMTNGYNISLNMSVSNFTNAKIFFGTNSGTQSGDRILLERSGNSISVKHDGGSFGSFSIAMKQYVVINIFVNLSGAGGFGNITVSSGGSKWSENLSNSHLTVNGSYIAFVPGQNMSTVNQNSTGWNISNINVTNVGTAYNISSTITGNSSMNVTIYKGDGTILRQVNGTLNNTDVTYNWTPLTDGTYTWYATVRSKDNVANTSLQFFNIESLCVVDYQGADWNVTSNINISGYYCNIRDWFVQPGVVVTINGWNGTNTTGWAKVNSTRNVFIYGNITGDGQGYGGGSGAGGGGGAESVDGSGSSSGGTPTNQNGTDGAAGSGGSTSSGGNGGLGGGGFNGTTGGTGGSGSISNEAAGTGGPGVFATANTDTTYADNATQGYGGGGGGGGGGGDRQSGNNGGGGGGGGVGGDGGAALVIKGTNITISGYINLRSGQLTCSTGSDGTDGTSSSNPVGGNGASNNVNNCASSIGGQGGESLASGGDGGDGGSGGAGAGGMVAVNATNALNYTGGVFNVSGGSVTNGGTVKLIYGTLIGSGTISGASATVVTPTNAIVVNLTNMVNGSRLSTYNYVLIGPSNLTGSNPASNTIFTNNLGSYTIFLTDIEGGSYVSQNVTFTLPATNITLNITTYQALLNVTTRLLYLNTTIAGFNITNVAYRNTTLTTSLIIPANNGTNNLQANVQGNYTVNGTCTATAFSVTQCAVQGVYDNIFKINATLDNGSQVLNFTVQVRNATFGGNFANATTSNGSAYFPLLQGYLYTFSINNTLYAYVSDNLPANSSTNFYQFSLSGSNLVNFTFYDEQNGSIVNGTNITLQVISDAQSQQYSTTTGRISTGPLLPGTYTLLYSASGYATRTSQFTLVDQTAPTLNLSMLLEPESTEATVTVIDDYGVKIPGAVVKLYKKDIPSNSYLVNQIFATDSNGQGVVTIQLTDTLYYWGVEINGNVVLTTTPSFLYSTAITLVVRGANNGFNTFKQNNDITGQITNTSNVYTFLFNDPDNTATQGCIYAWIYTYNNKAIYNSSCAATSSGSVSITVNNNTGTYYLIQGYVTKNAVNNLIDTVTTQLRTLLNNENREKTGLFALFFVLLIIIFIFKDTLRWAIIIGSFIPLIFSIFGFINVPVGVTGVLFIAGIIIGAIIGE